eukprot:scaffold14649_cov124-Isochrysis_galbana.AAC.1
MEGAGRLRQGRALLVRAWRGRAAVCARPPPPRDSGQPEPPAGHHTEGGPIVDYASAGAQPLLQNQPVPPL